MPSATDDSLQGFVRIINLSDRAGMVRIDAWDDTGYQVDPLMLSVKPHKVAYFNSNDLESGSPDSNLAGAAGPGTGSWRIVLSSTLSFDAMAYVESADGFLTTIHDVMEPVGQIWRVPTFNPSDDDEHVSGLRLSNPYTTEATITIDGVDDEGDSPGTTVHLMLAEGSSRTITSAELETGNGVSGALGDGNGKWRLTLWSDRRISVVNLLSSATGYLTSLSSKPLSNWGTQRRQPINVWYFPSAASAPQGLVRLVNRTLGTATVGISATDDGGWTAESVELQIGGGQTVQISSDDLESGNVDKGLSFGTGSGDGDWWLKLTSESEIEVLAYLRTEDGFLTAAQDSVRGSGTLYRVGMFYPVGDTHVSKLRIVNPGETNASVEIKGTDDEGAQRNKVNLTVEAKSSKTVSAQELEEGGVGLDGALGDGIGRWRLSISSNVAIQIVNLVESPAGHTSNLSTQSISSSATER